MNRLLPMALLGVAGCAAARPPMPEPLTVPPRFAVVPESVTAPAAPDPTAYWSDDAPLAQILEVGLRDAPSLAEAQARITEASARRRNAAWELAPSLTGAAGYVTQQRSAATTFGAPIPRRFDTYDVGASASLEVDVFGRLRRQLRARAALVGAAQADREAVQIGLTSEIASTYFTLREVQNRLQVAHDNAENQRRSLELTSQRLEGGKGTDFDVQRARAQFATTTATIPILEGEAAALSASVAALAGQAPGTFDSLLASGGSLPEAGADLSFGTPSSLIARNPDVRRAERTLAAAHGVASSASAGLLPRLILGGEVGTTSLEANGLFGARNGRYAFGPIISWPVLNLGQLVAERDAAVAQQVQAEAQYRATVLLVLRDAESALQRFQGSRSSLASLEIAATASGAATALATLRYQEGVTDFLQVLDAQRTQLEAEDRLVRGRGDMARAMVEVYRSLAVGGMETSDREH